MANKTLTLQDVWIVYERQSSGKLWPTVYRDKDAAQEQVRSFGEFAAYIQHILGETVEID